MIEYLKRLFGIGQNIPVDKTDDKPLFKVKSPFSVEHYPESRYYFAKYKNDYLREKVFTGLIERVSSDFFVYAEKFRTEEEAWKFIDKYKEQRFKKNIQILTRDE